MTFNQTNFAAFLKRYYSGQKLNELIYQDAPFFAMLKKDKSWGGNTYHYVTPYEAPITGRSASASTAATNGASSYTRAVQWALTSQASYNHSRLGGETLRAAKSAGPGAFAPVMKTAMDGLYKGHADDIEIQLFGNGYGAIGRIAAGTAASVTTFTLATPDDIFNFKVGQVLVASAQSDGTSIRQTSSVDNTATVTAVDRDAGTVTISVATDSFGSGDWVASDYLYVQGDPATVISGLGRWLPSTAPSSGDSFFGVDRSVDTVRLGGCRITSAGSKIATINAATHRVAREPMGRPDVLFMNFDDLGALVNEMEGSRQYIDQAGKMQAGGVGFDTIKIRGPKGLIDVFGNAHCPKGTGFLLTKETWVLCSRGEPIDFDRDDGLIVRSIESSDAVWMRSKGYMQLGCTAPGANARITF